MGLVRNNLVPFERLPGRECLDECAAAEATPTRLCLGRRLSFIAASVTEGPGADPAASAAPHALFLHLQIF